MRTIYLYLTIYSLLGLIFSKPGVEELSFNMKRLRKICLWQDISLSVTVFCLNLFLLKVELKLVWTLTRFSLGYTKVFIA